MSGTTSIREQIVDKVMTLFQAVGAPAGVTIHRERTRPLENEQLPAIVIYLGEEDPIPLAHQNFKAPLLERQLVLYVESRAIGLDGEAPDEALDPLTVWATKQLVGNEKLDGLAMGVIEGKTVWLSKEGDQPIAAALTMFVIRYRTDRIDPTSQNSGGLS